MEPIKKSKRKGPSATNRELTLNTLHSIGEGSAFDIMDAYLKVAPLDDEVARFTFCQGVHSACSTLHKEGEIIRVRISTNPRSGEEVYVYRVNEGEKVASTVSSKGYKERYEQLLEENEKLKAQVEFMVTRIDYYRSELMNEKLNHSDALRVDSDRQPEEFAMN